MASEYGPEFDKWVEKVRTELVPKIDGSAIFVSITPSKPEKVDVKFAVELGLAIMMNKPIIATCQPGTEIPEKLTKVVDRFVEMDFNDTAESAKRLGETAKELINELGLED